MNNISNTAPQLSRPALAALTQLRRALTDSTAPFVAIHQVAKAAAYATTTPKKGPEGWLMEEVREFLRAEGDDRYDELIDVCYALCLVVRDAWPANNAALNDPGAVHDMLVATSRISTLNMTDSQALSALDRWFEKNRRRGVTY